MTVIELVYFLAGGVSALLALGMALIFAISRRAYWIAREARQRSNERGSTGKKIS